MSNMPLSRVLYGLFIVVSNPVLLLNGQMEEPNKACDDNSYWRHRYKSCFPCSNICSTTVLSLSDACKESCPRWKPRLVTTPVTTESSDVVGNDMAIDGKQTILTAIAIIITVIGVGIFALLLYRRCTKRKEATAGDELLFSMPVQESMPPHEDSRLLTDRDSTSSDLSVNATNTKIASGSTIQDVQHNDRDETSVKMIYRYPDEDSRCNSGGHIGGSSHVTDRAAAENAGIVLGLIPHGESADGSIGRQENHFVSLDDGAVIAMKNADEENMNELVFKDPGVIKLHIKENNRDIPQQS